MKKIRPALYHSTFTLSFAIKQFYIHSWFCSYNFKHYAINLCVRKVIKATGVNASNRFKARNKCYCEQPGLIGVPYFHGGRE